MNDSIENIKIRALQTEIARNQAEQHKLEKETEEIVRNLKTTFLGITLSALIKTILAAIVAGFLFGDVVMSYVTKINIANEKLLEQTENNYKELEENTKNYEILITKAESEKKELEDYSKKVESERDEFQKQLLASIQEADEAVRVSAEIATDVASPTEVKTVTAIEKLQSQWVAKVHNLEEQQAILPQLPQNQLSPAAATQTGWVYLGEYNNRKWVTKYFDFSSTLKPDKLINTKSIVDVNSINVRDEKFSGERINILSKGDEIFIINVEPYTLTNYMWAQVRY